MKLYSAGLSPFASRPRLAIYAKNLPVDIVAPPEAGLKSPEYLAINPMGKLPALQLDDGTVIPESDTIVEYLADRFPNAGLRPSTPEKIAQGRLIARVAELYVMNAGGSLFGQMAPQGRDQAVIDAAFKGIDAGLTHLDAFMTDDRYAAGETLTSADCALVPLLFFMNVFQQVFGRDVLSRHGKVATYWSRVQTDPAVQKVLGEMGEALRARAAALAPA
ncbi:MAG TPA: glutathione S-transferase family protein [Phenylobacterium sp.]